MAKRKKAKKRKAVKRRMPPRCKNGRFKKRGR